VSLWECEKQKKANGFINKADFGARRGGKITAPEIVGAGMSRRSG